MSFVRKTAVIVLSLFLVIVLVGFMLPRRAHVERSVEIQLPPERVYLYLNDLHNFISWSPWAKLDPQTRYSFSGPKAGVGAKMTWESEQAHVGHGSQEIISSEPGHRIVVALDFGGQSPATSYYELQSVQNGTKVTWGFDTKFGWNIFARYFGLLLDKALGQQFEEGLNGLRTALGSASSEMGGGGQPGQ